MYRCVKRHFAQLFLSPHIQGTTDPRSVTIEPLKGSLVNGVLYVVQDGPHTPPRSRQPHRLDTREIQGSSEASLRTQTISAQDTVAGTEGQRLEGSEMPLSGMAGIVRIHTGALNAGLVLGQVTWWS